MRLDSAKTGLLLSSLVIAGALMVSLFPADKQVDSLRVSLVTVSTSEGLAEVGFGSIEDSPYNVSITAISLPSSQEIQNVAALLSGVQLDVARYGGGRFDIPAIIPTIAQRLRDRGGISIAVTSTESFQAGYGFDRGFEHYVDINYTPHNGGEWPEVIGGADALATFEALKTVSPRAAFQWIHFDALSERTLGSLLALELEQSGEAIVIILGTQPSLGEGETPLLLIDNGFLAHSGTTVPASLEGVRSLLLQTVLGERSVSHLFEPMWVQGSDISPVDRRFQSLTDQWPQQWERPHLRSQFENAQTLLKAHMTKAAERELLHLRSCCANEPAVSSLLAQMSYQRGDLKSEIETWKAFFDATGDIWVGLEIANRLLLYGDSEEALNWYQMVARTDAQSVEARLGEHRSRRALGLGDAEAWIVGRGDEGADELLLATDSLEVGDHSGALNHASQAVKLRPRDAYAWSLLARVCYETGALDAAVTASDRAASLEPYAINLMLERSQWLEDAGLSSRSLRELVGLRGVFVSNRALGRRLDELMAGEGYPEQSLRGSSRLLQKYQGGQGSPVIQK